MVQSVLALCRARTAPDRIPVRQIKIKRVNFIRKSFFGGIMTIRSIKLTLLLTGVLFFLSFAACTPKCIINGRVVDAETKHPIKGAAVAIRWYEEDSDPDAGKARTIEAAQDLSDEKGHFNIPEHPDNNYVMGVYKEGYICWSSRSRFANGKKIAAITRPNIQVEDGMEIYLEPLKAGHSQDQHAGFTVLVAEEVTESKKTPFYKAIKPMFKRWRDNLRKEFKKMFGRNNSAKSK